ERKSLPNAVTEKFYEEFVNTCDGTLVLLDWDNRVPRLESWRVRHLTDFGNVSTLQMFALMLEADLLMGVDSGPLHAARLTDIPTIGMWMPGHYLQEAADMGDVLIVGVNSDDSIRRLKGTDRPVYPQDERVTMLSSLGCVDHVVVFEDDTPHRLLHAIRPDVLVKGGTYSIEEVIGHEVVEANGGEVRVTGMIPLRSTTGVIRQLREREAVNETD
ncbi:MAG: adenylyltransferase/cytidyltransferase family protein, partial [Planctomycetaceae bacterium]